MGYCRSVVMFFLLAGFFSQTLSAQNPRVVLETNFGDIVIELYPDDAPISVDNFLSYVNSGFYDGLLFHRVENRNEQNIGLDVIQGGGFYAENYTIYYSPPIWGPIINESYNGLSNTRGTIAMARTTDPNSATSQFYINHQDNTELDYVDQNNVGYCVFGQVSEGLDVVDAIALVEICYVSTSFPTFPCNPTVDIINAYVLPCEVSYCSNLTGDSRIGFEDFAVFASRWLDVCGSDNNFCDGSDLNYNGTVDVVDLELFLDHWVRITGYEPVFSDLVSNSSIDSNDLSALMEQWLDTDCNEENVFCDGADIDHSGAVDFTDFALFSNNWMINY